MNKLQDVLDGYYKNYGKKQRWPSLSRSFWITRRSALAKQASMPAAVVYQPGSGAVQAGAVQAGQAPHAGVQGQDDDSPKQAQQQLRWHTLRWRPKTTAKNTKQVFLLPEHVGGQGW
jgi:hypothetical protein